MQHHRNATVVDWRGSLILWINGRTMSSERWRDHSRSMYSRCLLKKRFHSKKICCPGRSHSTMYWSSTRVSLRASRMSPPLAPPLAPRLVHCVCFFDKSLASNPAGDCLFRAFDWIHANCVDPYITSPLSLQLRWRMSTWITIQAFSVNFGWMPVTKNPGFWQQPQQGSKEIASWFGRGIWNDIHSHSYKLDWTSIRRIIIGSTWIRWRFLLLPIMGFAVNVTQTIFSNSESTSEVMAITITISPKLRLELSCEERESQKVGL